MSINGILMALAICGDFVSGPAILARAGRRKMKACHRQEHPVHLPAHFCRHMGRRAARREGETGQSHAGVRSDQCRRRLRQLKGGFGKYDIIVRYADGYLHFIQSFLERSPIHDHGPR